MKLGNAAAAELHWWSTSGMFSAASVAAANISVEKSVIEAYQHLRI